MERDPVRPDRKEESLDASDAGGRHAEGDELDGEEQEHEK